MNNYGNILLHFCYKIFRLEICVYTKISAHISYEVNIK